MTNGQREHLRQQLIVDEGCVLNAYQDSEGWWTIGIGHLIDKRKGGSIPQSIADALLEYDIERTWRALVDRYPWVTRLDPVRQNVLCNMAFNLGIRGLSTFKLLLFSVEHGDFQIASARMLASKWATQVGARAERLARQMHTGEL